MGDVYCKDCKFLHRNMYDYNLLTCVRKYGLPSKVKDPINGVVEKASLLPEAHPEDRNRNLNCYHFEPKLWLRFLKWIFLDKEI